MDQPNAVSNLPSGPGLQNIFDPRKARRVPRVSVGTFYFNPSPNLRSAWLMVTCPASDTLEYYGRHSTKGKQSGNERLLWHGTRRGCNLGEAGQTTLCMVPRCSLCSVIRGSSGTGKLAVDTPAGRFGTGIYTFTNAMKYVHLE